MRIRSRGRSAITVTAIGLFCAGCCHRPQQITANTRSYAIFNPPNSPIMLAENHRNDWPIAYAGDAPTEELTYYEHIVDYQGRNFHNGDGFLYRRFESDRFGRGRR